VRPRNFSSPTPPCRGIAISQFKRIPVPTPRPHEVIGIHLLRQNGEGLRDGEYAIRAVGPVPVVEEDADDVPIDIVGGRDTRWKAYGLPGPIAASRGVGDFGLGPPLGSLARHCLYFCSLSCVYDCLVRFSRLNGDERGKGDRPPEPVLPRRTLSMMMGLHLNIYNSNLPVFTYRDLHPF